MRIYASQLRNNDKVRMVDGLITVKDFKMVLIEDIVTFTAIKEDGTEHPRWAAMNSIVDKVMTCSS